MVQQVRKISGTARKAHMAGDVARGVFLICAVLLIAVIVSVFVFIGFNAFRVFTEGATFKDFLFTSSWDPTGNNDVNGNPHFGAGGLILGSMCIYSWKG